MIIPSKQIVSQWWPSNYKLWVVKSPLWFTITPFINIYKLYNHLKYPLVSTGRCAPVMRMLVYKHHEYKLVVFIINHGIQPLFLGNWTRFPTGAPSWTTKVLDGRPRLHRRRCGDQTTSPKSQDSPAPGPVFLGMQSDIPTMIESNYFQYITYINILISI